MADITIKFEGVSAIIAALEGIKIRIDGATREATKDSGERLQRDARTNFHGAHAVGFHHVGGAWPNTVTGHLQESIIFLTPIIPEGRAKYSTRIGPTAIYGRVIELGARITPKVAQYLSWFDAEVGKQRYSKGVTIPPRPYFTPARMTLPPRMESIFYAAWRGAWTNG